MTSAWTLPASFHPPASQPSANASFTLPPRGISGRPWIQRSRGIGIRVVWFVAGLIERMFSESARYVPPCCACPLKPIISTLMRAVPPSGPKSAVDAIGALDTFSLNALTRCQRSTVPTTVTSRTSTTAVPMTRRSRTGLRLRWVASGATSSVAPAGGPQGEVVVSARCRSRSTARSRRARAVGAACARERPNIAGKDSG